jgi:NAD(P)H-dependent flavin oxidoreductase YrpB (nitropropane dioxygenase family)
MFSTRITKLLGIQHPVICGCMQWLTRAELVAAVAEAGGLGIIPAATFDSIDEIKQEIRKTRQLTSKPFAVNVTLIPMGRPFSHAEMLKAAIDEGVPVIETAARNPQDYMDLIRSSGAVHMHKCARVQDVVKAVKLGADMVTVVGFECGGHPGHQDVSTMVKVSRAVNAVDVPIAAGGGISDGRGLVAALSLGAEAVVMGTRFFATRECPAHDEIKAALVGADETSTGLALATLEPVRALRNQVLERVGELETKGASIAEMYPLVSGRRGLKAYMSGNADDALIPCGQGVGLIDDIPSVAELMERIMSDAARAVQRINGLAHAS